MPKSNTKKANFNRYAAALLVIALIFCTAGYLIISMIHNFYYDQMDKESQRLAKSYAHNLETAIGATDIINNLLEEKISAAGKVVASFDENPSNELLAKLAVSMAVDEVYWYNAAGEIIYSNSGKYIGWTAHQGHPVYDFMISDKENLVEDIRKDSESDLFYKYGYFKAADGNFVQIGVLADKIHEFLGDFEMQHLLSEMKEGQNVKSACFIDSEMNIVADCEYSSADIELLNDKAKTAIQGDTPYIKALEHNSEKLYQIMLPIYMNYEKAGTLVMLYDLKDTQIVIRNISFIGIFALVFIFILILITILSNYYRFKQLTHYAYYDLLTNLPNKRSFEEAVNAQTNKAHEEKRAVVMVNYRNFRLINLTFGDQYGDTAIRETAELFSALCSSERTLFHLSADRFVFYIKSYNDKAELSEFCDSIINVLRNTLASKTIGGNIGAVEISGLACDADALLKKAYIAAGTVNENELFGYCFFNSQVEATLQRKEDIKYELERISSSEGNTSFYLEYQPVLDLKANRVTSFEALSRLKSEKLGFVSPVEFIPIAESTQLIVPIGKYIIRTACLFLKSLEIKGYTDIKIAVNISAIQLLMDDFIPDIMQIIAETQITPSNLSIELTESVFSDNFLVINEKLAKIRAMGMDVAIDDFGTGYSSLSRQKELDVNFLKIDKSFMDKLLVLRSEETITQDIISMAHRLGHLVIAEGVEFEAQKEYLIQNGCDFMQGYLFSRPLAQDAAIELLNKQGKLLCKIL